MQLIEGFVLGVLSLIGLLFASRDKIENTALEMNEKRIKANCADQAILNEDDQLEWWKRELFKARERYLR